MRVISGSLGGRRLVTSKGNRTRPTSDLVRKSLFDSLEPTIAGSFFVDGFAGCGAVGIEAASRGAAHVTFVESDPAALAALRTNLSALGLRDRATVLARDATEVLRRLDRLVFGDGRWRDDAEWPHELIVFADPPYEAHLAPQALEACAVGLARLRSQGSDRVRGMPCRVIVQHSRREILAGRYGELVRVRERRHGDTILTEFRADGAQANGKGAACFEDCGLSG